MTAQRIGLAIAAAVALTLAVQAQVTDRAGVALQAAIKQELVNGNLASAIKQYEAIVSAYGKTNRPVAAQALLHMAEAYQKQGSAEARKVYERIVKDYGDQATVASGARARLAALPDRSTRAGESPTDRVVLSGPDAGAIRSLSPDGRTALLVDGDRGLGVRDMTTGQVQWIVSTRRGEENGSPVFSPDLEQIVYTFIDKEGNAQLRLVGNQPGASPRTLIDSREFVFYMPTGWSADGKSVLTSIVRKDLTWETAWVSLSDGSIKVLKSLDWRFRDGNRLSPDGRYIAYAAFVTNPTKAPPAPPDSRDVHIWILAADGTSETELIGSAGVNTLPFWTTDGRHLLFSSDRSGQFDLWAVPVQEGKATEKPRRVKAGLGGPSWGRVLGPNHDAYYYTANASDPFTTSIAPIRMLGGRMVAGSETSTIMGDGPTFSPDSKSVAVFRGSGVLVVASTATGEEHSLGIAGTQGKVVWFHDGKRIALQRPVQNGRPLHVGGLPPGSWEALDLRTGEFSRLVPADPGDSRYGGALSPDDRTLYFAATRATNASEISDRLVAVDLITGQSRVLFTTQPRSLGLDSMLLNLGGGINFALSPDGRALVLRTYDLEAGEAHIARISTDGSGYRELYKARQTGNANNYRLAWTTAGIFFTQLATGTSDQLLMRIAADTGSVETAALAFDIGRGFSLSPDGSAIALVKVPTRELRALDLPSILKRPQ